MERPSVNRDLYAVFRRAVDCPEEDIDLGKAALAIAKGECPNLGGCFRMNSTASVILSEAKDLSVSISAG